MTRTFGSNIKAARLGYHWSERHGAFIRMVTVGSRMFVELAPASGVPNKSETKSKDYRCWRDDDSILDRIPWLRNVRRIKRYVAVEVDERGNIVKELTRAN